MKSFAIAGALALIAATAAAQPTHVMVRARSLDAKFIGDHTGGMKITLRDARTGKMLASGLTRGGTGDTPRLMKTPQTRGEILSDAETGGFDAVIDIDQPTLVQVDGEGPMGVPGAAVKVSSSLWVLPGHDVTGDGLVLTVPGLAVTPTAETAADGSVAVKAKVTLMCGCPIEPGGIWNADNYTVEAQLLKAGKVVAEAPLAYAGTASQFAGSLPKPAAGAYVLRVVAADAGTPNAGVAEQPFKAR